MLRRNVLIFHAGALGDFVLTWPLAMALARIHPQSRIFYVTAASKGRLAERALGVESKDAEGGWQHLFGDPAKLPDPVRRTLEGAQTIVNFVAADADAWARNARDVSRGADVVTLRPRPPATAEHQHVSTFILHQLTPHRVLHAAAGQMIASVGEKGAGTTWRGGGPIVLHPGSGSRDKCWPVPKWVELAARLGRDNVRILLGEVERERLTAAEVKSLGAAADLRWPPDYLDLLGELSQARAFIGNDSGPGHLAAVIGVPTVALFGPTNPDVWRPLGPRVTAVRNGTSLAPPAVESIARDFLAHAPDAPRAFA